MSPSTESTPTSPNVLDYARAESILRGAGETTLLIRAPRAGVAEELIARLLLIGFLALFTLAAGAFAVALSARPMMATNLTPVIALPAVITVGAGLLTVLALRAAGRLLVTPAPVVTVQTRPRLLFISDDVGPTRTLDRADIDAITLTWHGATHAESRVCAKLSVYSVLGDWFVWVRLTRAEAEQCRAAIEAWLVRENTHQA